MPNYYKFYWDATPELKKHLKPICCQSCKDGNGGGFRCAGECKKCLENQAWNREYLETHPFITDTYYRPYHTDEHSDIKTLPLRLPNEHPYLYYGIELEVEFNGVGIYTPDDDDYEDEDDNWKINDILHEFSKITDGLFVYEADGSLANGVELISRPCSYAFWTSKETVDKLKKGMEYLRSQGALVEQPETNGMHVHISRKFFDFGNTKLENRQTAYESFDWLFQKFQPEIEQLGGRKYTSYCESKASKLRKSLVDNNWAISSYNVEAEIKCTLKKGGEMARGDHYSAVNMNCHTIETRVFKSSTDYKQILANIELVRNFAHAVRDEDIEKSLNELLHTKDNLFLDEHISRVRMACAKKKETLDLDKVNDNKIEILVSK